MRTLETKTLHKGVAGARHAFLPLPPNSNKLDVLVQVRLGLRCRHILACFTLVASKATSPCVVRRPW